MELKHHQANRGQDWPGWSTLCLVNPKAQHWWTLEVRRKLKNWIYYLQRSLQIRFCYPSLPLSTSRDYKDLIFYVSLFFFWLYSKYDSPIPSLSCTLGLYYPVIGGGGGERLIHSRTSFSGNCLRGKASLNKNSVFSCVLLKAYVVVLTSSTVECDHTWTQGL